MKQIQLTKGKFAMVDDCDFELVNKFKWCAKRKSGAWYVVRTERVAGKKITVLLHRFITKAEKGVQIDHRDRDGLNNQRFNLRPCNNAQNQMNSVCRNKHGFKGVEFDSRLVKKPWVAKIWVNGKRRTVGFFETLHQAAAAYNTAAANQFGEFARLNQFHSAL